MTDASDISEKSAVNEHGYILAGVVIVLAVFMIMLSVAAPKVRDELRRDRELETTQRGRQYVRAVQLYYRRFHRFPADVDALSNTNGIRFLRRRYRDPLTGADDWTPIGLGQNKAPLSLGLFGQVLNGGAAVPPTGHAEQQNSVLGTPPPSAYDPVFNSISGPASTSSAAGEASTGTSADASSGKTYGGAGIIGFSPTSSRSSILIYKTKSRYDQWEFVYDPASDGVEPGRAQPPAAPPPDRGTAGMNGIAQ